MTKQLTPLAGGAEQSLPIPAQNPDSTTTNTTATTAKPAPSSNPNASRLRDNQRRSRARKKEYVASLEAKYQECQRLGIEASIEIQNAARAVVRENQRLRELLRKVGVVDEEVDRWIVDGGLEEGAVGRVQKGLGRKPCPPLDGVVGAGGCGGGKCGGSSTACEPGALGGRSRAEVLARRSSTGGMLMKVRSIACYIVVCVAS
ncbi:hypothetical protein BDZ91DRAFT_796303 [Kalaharituber pfeilii]|nr:hypothetical protein BDZ91DRAFT_796303 [Kalaharituber pfeilii]